MFKQRNRKGPQTWFTSDLHLNHDREFIWGVRAARPSKLSRKTQPFSNVDDMNTHIYRTVFGQVRHGDTIYFLGDIAMSKEKFDTIKLFFRCLDLAGTKIVWHLGNHDNKSHPEKILEEFPNMNLTWVPMKEVRPLPEDDRFVTSHFPLKGTLYGDGGHDERETHLPYVDGTVTAGKVLLHGHTHSKDKGDGIKMIHVGFDSWGRMVSLDELVRFHTDTQTQDTTR